MKEKLDDWEKAQQRIREKLHEPKRYDHFESCK